METIIFAYGMEINSWFNVHNILDVAAISVMSGIGMVGFSHLVMSTKNFYYELIS